MRNNDNNVNYDENKIHKEKIEKREITVAQIYCYSKEMIKKNKTGLKFFPYFILIYLGMLVVLPILIMCDLITYEQGETITNIIYSPIIMYPLIGFNVIKFYFRTRVNEVSYATDVDGKMYKVLCNGYTTTIPSIATTDPFDSMKTTKSTWNNKIESSFVPTQNSKDYLTAQPKQIATAIEYTGVYPNIVIWEITDVYSVKETRKYYKIKCDYKFLNNIYDTELKRDKLLIIHKSYYKLEELINNFIKLQNKSLNKGEKNG